MARASQSRLVTWWSPIGWTNRASLSQPVSTSGSKTKRIIQCMQSQISTEVRRSCKPHLLSERRMCSWVKPRALSRVPTSHLGPTGAQGWTERTSTSSLRYSILTRRETFYLQYPQRTLLLDLRWTQHFLMAQLGFLRRTCMETCSAHFTGTSSTSRNLSTRQR